MYLAILFHLFKWKTEQQAQPSLKHVIVSETLGQFEAAYPLPCLLSLSSPWCSLPLITLPRVPGLCPTWQEPTATHSFPEFLACRTWSQEPKAHLPRSDQKKERGHLLCCYRVLLPIVPECSGKIGISSFSGQHSSEWRWDSPSDPSLLRPHSWSHRCPRPERDCVFKAPGVQSQHLSHYRLHPTNTCLLHSDHSDWKREREGENHTSFCRWPQVDWNCV